MASLKRILRNVWWQRVALAAVGGAIGYWYYATIGCEQGCAITGDPMISTAYGALVGFLAHPGRFRTTPGEANSKEGA